MIVRELELDLDAFEGPFDLLLTLVLKEELDLADVDVAAIVVAFLEHATRSVRPPRRLADAGTDSAEAALRATDAGAEREQLDLEADGEFLVLVAALL